MIGQAGDPRKGQEVPFLMSETHVSPCVPTERLIRRVDTVTPGPTRARSWLEPHNGHGVVANSHFLSIFMRLRGSRKGTGQ